MTRNPSGVLDLCGQPSGLLCWLNFSTLLPKTGTGRQIYDSCWIIFDLELILGLQKKKRILISVAEPVLYLPAPAPGIFFTPAPAPFHIKIG